MSTNSIDNAANHFLFVAHPGHELCVHAWLTGTHPKVFVLTDGSGRGKPRIASTTKVLEQAGAQPGSIYGRFADAELYELILKCDFQPLLRIVDEFAQAIITDDVSEVAGDAIEGYNPAHDTCRLIINSAVAIARRRSGRQISNRDFLLVGRDLARADNGDVCLRLNDAAFEQKLQAARGFPELQSEIEATLAGETLALREYPQLNGEFSLERNNADRPYRTEVLRHVDDNGSGDEFLGSAPFYERYGELRVAAGYYRHVIRYREHMLPLTEALVKYAAGD